MYIFYVNAGFIPKLLLTKQEIFMLFDRIIKKRCIFALTNYSCANQ